MVLTSKFGGGNATPGTGNYLAASLDFMVEPTAANKTRLAAACIEHNPGRAGDLNAYFARHAIVEPATPAATPAASALKKPLSGL